MIQALLGRRDAEPGGRGHITRGLQATLRSLNFISRETGSYESKSPRVLAELTEWRPQGQATSLLSQPNHLSSSWLLKSWQKERLEGQHETDRQEQGEQ